MFKFLIVALLATFMVFGFEQHDYFLIFERGEVVSFNTKFVRNFRIRTFKYNRTQAVMNMSIDLKIDFGNNVKVKVEGYKFASNEYRGFPIVFERRLCSMINSDEFGLRNLYKCGNISTCPIKKGSYHMCNWFPEESKLPPFVPIGSYKLEMTYMLDSEEVWVFNLYAT
ncbi:hypothetical protein ILUMI_06971, partial [Ignelater luminosus]